MCDEKTEILIVEDNGDDYNQIVGKLGDTYKPVRVDRMNEFELMHYKALHPRAQIVIVDLELQDISDAGMHVISTLWKLTVRHFSWYSARVPTRPEKQYSPLMVSDHTAHASRNTGQAANSQWIV